jgi:hypothetical protein
MANDELSLELTDTLRELLLIVESSIVSYGIIDEYLEARFNDFISAALALKIKTIANFEIESGTRYNYVLILSDSKELSHWMLLKGVSISLTESGVEFHCVAQGGWTYPIRDCRFFIVCPACPNICLGAENLERLAKYRPVRRYILPSGWIIQYPRRLKPKTMILEYIMSTFSAGAVLQAEEINKHLRFFHPDYALLRRELVDFGYMERTKDGRVYTVKAP